MTRKQVLTLVAAVVGALAVVLIAWNVRNLFGPPRDPAAGRVDETGAEAEQAPPASAGRVAPGASVDD